MPTCRFISSDGGDRTARIVETGPLVAALTSGNEPRPDIHRPGGRQDDDVATESPQTTKDTHEGSASWWLPTATAIARNMAAHVRSCRTRTMMRTTKRMVRRFATFLTGRGIWVDLDVVESNKERQDWAGWATTRMTRADYVLVIVSARYRLVADGEADGDVHRGAQYEARILREWLYGDPDTWRRKILPVVLPGHAVTDIPIFLEPRTNTHFIIEEIDDVGTDELLRVLTGQPRDMRPRLGRLPELGPHVSTKEPDATRTDGILDVDGGVFDPTVPIEDRLDRLDLVLAEVEAERTGSAALARRGRAPHPWRTRGRQSRA